jgi:hypothetical protein
MRRDPKLVMPASSESDIACQRIWRYQTTMSGMIFGFQIDAFRDAMSSPDEN